MKQCSCLARRLSSMIRSVWRFAAAVSLSAPAQTGCGNRNPRAIGPDSLPVSDYPPGLTIHLGATSKTYTSNNNRPQLLASQATYRRTMHAGDGHPQPDLDAGGGSDHSR